MGKMAMRHADGLPDATHQPGGWKARIKSNPLPALAAICVVTVLLLVGIGWLTAEKPRERPYLNVLGGGFIFNYRVSDIYYGIAVVPVHSVDVGDIVEARFEDPSGGPDILVRKRFGLVHEPTQLRTPPLRGVVAGRPYRVELRLLAREDGHLVWSTVLHYKSSLDSKIINREPPVLGPGYHRNPAYRDAPDPNARVN